MRWDIFCVVIDNYGDIGTCWRLARQLVKEHAVDVRVWVDDLAAFSKLCAVEECLEKYGLIARKIGRESQHEAHQDVRFAFSFADANRQTSNQLEICHWPADHFPEVDVADVVIEAFACEIPAAYVASMQRRSTPPIWINLEYLSAESWVEECHRMASPHPQFSLMKYFFFPGFSALTGGLICERDLKVDQNTFDEVQQAAFWKQLGIPYRTANELRVCLFCYENVAFEEWLQSLEQSAQPITVLATEGIATQRCRRFGDHGFAADSNGAAEEWRLNQKASKLEEDASGIETQAREASVKIFQRGALTIYGLPFLSQPDFDRLLWSCDLNFVRGEDSLVRAQWAQRPFVWNIYPQSEAAHVAKLDAYLNHYLQDSVVSESVRRFWRAWNGLGDVKSEWLEFARQLKEIESHNRLWSRQLDRLGDLTNNLADFVAEIRLKGLEFHHK